MEPTIQQIAEKKLIGQQVIMSLSDNKTRALWQRFMQERHTIKNNLTAALYSIQVYDPGYFLPFHPGKTFQKWAALEVTETDPLPPGMESLLLPEGQYAVFHYRGRSTDNSIFQYIFTSWLPNSAFILDDRPHFEVLGEKYKNDSPDSEEEIWIPVKQK